MDSRSRRAWLCCRLAPCGETSARGDECFFEYEEQKGLKYPARGIVWRNFKYIDYLGRSEKDVMYDLKWDPNETTNILALAGDKRHIQKRYESVHKVLEQRLEHWRRETGDPTMK